MAKKVVATLQSRSNKKFSKVIVPVLSPKSGAYTFKEKIVSSDEVQEYIKKVLRS